MVLVFLEAHGSGSKLCYWCGFVWVFVCLCVYCWVAVVVLCKVGTETRAG